MIFGFRKILFLFLFSLFSNLLLSQNDFVIKEINISGNKTTKNFIISRELMFSVNDTINEADLILSLEKSKENLNNTSLFNFVFIDTIGSMLNEITINIKVEERWYLWPYIIFEHADRNLSSWIQSRDVDMVNYGLYFVKYNFRGRNEQLKIKARMGYKEQYAIQYYKPFFDKNLKIGANLSLSYFRQKEVAYTTFNNKLIYYRNKYNYIKKSINTNITFNYRPKFYLYHFLSIAYNSYSISDSLLENNSSYLMNGLINFEINSLGYSIILDKRNSNIYPTSGVYAGFNIFENFNFNNFNNLNIKTVFKYYYSISNKLNLASLIKYKYSYFKNYSYLFYEGLGYFDYIRGFEYYVIDGSQFVNGKLGVGYNLLPNKIKTISFLPFEKFKKIYYSSFLNLFFDFGYVYDEYSISYNNNLANQFLYSAGIGLDIITYYDKVFRIEYTINKFKDKGLYLHFSSAI